MSAIANRLLYREEIKILWILISNRWGGVEQVALADLQELVQVGLNITLVCMKGSPVHASATRIENLKIETLEELPKSRFDFSYLNKLKQLVVDREINILHLGNDFFLSQTLFEFWRFKNVAIVYNFFSLTKAKKFSWLQLLGLRRVDYVLVLNESIKNFLMTSALVSEKKIKSIHLGLDANQFNPALANAARIRERWNIDHQTLVIGFLARIDRESGQDTFIKAAAGVVLQKPDAKIKFVIVAEDPLSVAQDFLTSLKTLAYQFHLEDHVIFDFLNNDLNDILSAFDVYVMPGKEEVPGLGALEALSLQRPVIVSNTMGSHSIVGNQEYGLQVRAEDAFDLKSKLLYLIANPTLREQMGTWGRKHIERFYDKHKRLDRILEVYHRCYKRRSHLKKPK